MGIAITILSVLCLALFVLATVFFGKYNKLKGDYASLNAETEQFIKRGERQDDTIRALVEQAKKDSNKSLVAYLGDSLAGTMQRVSGDRRLSLEELNKKLAKVPGADTAPLLGVLTDREQKIAALTGQLDVAEKARTQALADRQNEIDRVKGIESRHKATIDAQTAEIDKYKEEVESYREGTNKVRAEMDANISRLANEAQAREDELRARIGKLQDETLVQQGIIARLRADNTKNLATGKAEEALVDATVIGLNPGANSVVIGIGSRQKVQLGMTFSVYADANSIRPDAQGNYMPGKGALEVINVGENSSTCRIRMEAKGNPIVTGDVVANPIYDPNKVYRFVVFGNFDVNEDGVATPQEQSDLRAVVENWGGRVQEDLGGDTDFLVLGERPVLPPKPGPDSPIEILQEYIRLNRVIDRYDQLYKQAIATGLPVLNQNRLDTLIGRVRGAR
jgi:hypothetical protein